MGFPPGITIDKPCTQTRITHIYMRVDISSNQLLGALRYRYHQPEVLDRTFVKGGLSHQILCRNILIIPCLYVETNLGMWI